MKEVKFNVEKFNEVCERIKETGKFEGTPVFSKTDVYGEIADRIYSTQNTVAKWACKNSKGPRDKDTAMALQNLLKEDFWEEDGYMPKKYSSITKNGIVAIYGLVEQYFAEDDFEDENKWAQTMAKIRQFELSIPEEDYKKITEFLNKNVADMVYDEATFAELYTEQYGEYGKNGVFEATDFTKFFARYYEIIMKKEEEFKKFMKENYAELIQK